MKIRCFAVSAVVSESTGDFLKRVAEEVKKLDDSAMRVMDIVLNFPTDVNPAEKVQAVVFYHSDSSDDNDDMDYVLFRSDSQDKAVESLEQNLEQIKNWLSQNKDVEIYDVSTQAVLDEEGMDVIQTIIYYGPLKESGR